jgi:RimJ/RimL family protein N-acetyltransferase
MKLVTDKPGDPPVIWEWMTKQTQIPWSSDLRTIAAIRDDGEIAAAVAFGSWTVQSCFIHVAFDTPHSLTKGLLKATFQYPFESIGVKAIYGLTPKDLKKAIRFNKKIGFKQIAETVDCVLLEMRREDCRYLKETLQ